MSEETKIGSSGVGESIIATNASWTFSGNVAESFSAHVKRSVPLYDIGHDLVCKISDFFLHDDSLCYELGVSTGTLIDKLATRHQQKEIRFVGIDTEDSMIHQAKKEINKRPNVELIADDINHFNYEPADLIVSYYTIQFIPPRQRQILFDKLYASLNWGGAFLLFEKVRACDARYQDIATSLYTDFKIDQGYTADEIVAKSSSLKGILEPFSTQGNLDLMKRAGFEDILTIMKYVCFEGFLAIK